MANKKSKKIELGRSRLLKGAGISTLYFTLGFIILLSSITFIIIITTTSYLTLLVFLGTAILVSVTFTLNITSYYIDSFTTVAFISFFIGAIVGILIGLIYVAPMVNIAAYSVSLQVSYPNHPNLTIIQNCTSFTTSASGYLNGQPINPQNTTQCTLPQSMQSNAALFNQLFNCNINGNHITCNTTFPNVTWQGTILNVSKR